MRNIFLLSLWLLVSCRALAQFAFNDLPFLALGQPGVTGYVPLGNMIFWYMADAPQYAGFANGQVVTNWADQSGHNNNATNFSGNAAIYTNNVLNGKPAFHMATGKHMFLSNSPFASATQAEIYVVCRAQVSPGTATKGGIWRLGSPGVVGQSGHPDNSSHGITENLGLKASYGPITIPGSLPWATNWHIYQAAVQSNEARMWYNGNIIGGIDTTFPIVFTNRPGFGQGEGGTFNFDGNFAEIIAYTNYLSVDERQSLYTYFYQKYGLGFTNLTQLYYPTNFQGLIAWYDANTFTSNNNDALTFWPDRSGLGRNMTNVGTGTGRPPKVQTSVFNSRPAVWFEDVNTNCMRVASTQLEMTNIFTAIVIHRKTNSALRALWGSTVSANARLRAMFNGANTLEMFVSSQITGGTSARLTNELQMGVWQRSSAVAGAFYINMTNSTFASGNGAGPYNLNVIGGYGAFPPTDNTMNYGGHIAEVCIYTNALSVADLTKLYYTYFKPKWGLP